MHADAAHQDLCERGAPPLSRRRRCTGSAAGRVRDIIAAHHQKIALIERHRGERDPHHAGAERFGGTPVEAQIADPPNRSNEIANGIAIPGSSAHG
jgi:hypothetical protein